MQEIIEKSMDTKSVLKSKLVEATFNYWYNDHEHIRCPIPERIHVELKELATKRFTMWLEDLPKVPDENDKKDLTEDVIHGKLEEFIFDEALKMITDEDEKITLMFPFLPRMGDKITAKDENVDGDESFIVARELAKEGDHSFIQVELEKSKSKERWSTKFELPA